MLAFSTNRCTAIYGTLLIALLLFATVAQAFEPIKPLPTSIDYDRQKAELGRRLFFDPILSADRTVSCATCHDPAFGWADPRPVSVGVHGRRGRINAPTVLNSYFNFRQFWNGRASNLKEQAAGPIHNPLEMDLSPEETVARLRDDPGYVRLFRAAYPGQPLTFARITEVIAEFEKALITPNSRLDRHLRGEPVLKQDELDGYRLFKQLGCVTCHNGINIGGNSYQYLGALIPTELDPADGDRFAITGQDIDRNRFKVPSLRNITLTSPYLHDGSEASLEKLIDLMAYHNLGLRLSKPEADLLMTFLNTLTGDPPRIGQMP
jgi:cytochrome c peroxidase